MSTPAYRQGHFYTCSEIAEAFKAGARDGRLYGEGATDALIERSADAYVKSVHPVVSAPRTLHDRAREAVRICGGNPDDAELLDQMARHIGHMRAEHEYDESRRAVSSPPPRDACRTCNDGAMSHEERRRAGGR